MKNKNYKKPNVFVYNFAKFILKIFSKIYFKPTIIRNELKHHKKGCVILCNHECALDFPLLISASKRRCTFVMSKSFYDTLPCQSIVSKMRMIPKQQFQTNILDVSKMKAVVDSNHPLAIYPAGLMTESGLSTPIPASTYKFIKFLDADIFVARVSGTYFVNAKWRKGFRKGKVSFDLYRLFSKEELEKLSVEEIQEKAEKALVFDAYAEQEVNKFIYKNNSDINGLERVLYKCPKCGKEGYMVVKNNNQIVCDACGYSETCDDLGFLHVDNKNDVEYRHVSKWDQFIYDDLKRQIQNDPNFELKSEVVIASINKKTHKFENLGEGILTLNKDFYTFDGIKNNEKVLIKESSKSFFILPSNPIKNCIEFQNGSEIFRFYLKNTNEFVIKWIHALKVFYELNTGIDMRVYPKGE